MSIYGDAEWAREVGQLLIGMADTLEGGGRPRLREGPLCGMS